MRGPGGLPPARIQRCRLPRRWIAFCLLLACAGAHASDPQRYRIRAGSLDDALHRLAHLSGIQLLYPPRLTAYRHSDKLEGRFTPAQALTTLLRGSGLHAEAVAPDTYVLQQTAEMPATIPPIPAVSVPDPPTSLATVEVTGTHIRRTALETASPLTVIDRRQIEHSGYQTLFELLRAQPGVRVNNAPVAMGDRMLFQTNGLSGATGAAAVDLHGLGATATLFLIDGQRMAGYGLAQGQFSLVNDLDSIPLALVERIEVLRDGASAIYGSDAMAGVVNIILRKHFDGVALDANTGLSTRGDASQHRGTATFGTRLANGGHLMLSLDYLERAPLLGRQRSWAYRPSHGSPSASDGSDGYFYFDGAQIAHTGALECSQFQPDGPCNNQAVALTNLQTALDSRSLLGHLDRPLGPLELYLDLRWNLLRQRQQTGPATEQLLIGESGQPDSYRQLNYAFDDVGPIRDLTQSRSNQLSLGLRNSSAEWAWNVRLDGQRNVGSDRVDGLLRTSVLDQALQDGSYQLGASDNSPALLMALSPTLLRTGSTSQYGFSAHTNGPLADWQAGAVSLAAGIEGYRERLDDHPDPLLIHNDVFQFQPPYVRRGDRWISAGYLELEAPLSQRLTTNVAARLDHSAGFGWAFSPRLAMKWDLSDSVSLRGTLARGYRAPTLPELDRPQALVPNGVEVEVPNALLPCREATPSSSSTSLCRLRLDSIGNPALRPERSRSLTLGMVLAPTPALGVALDVYQIRREHEIKPLPVSYALEHPEAYPQLFRRDANGVLYAFDQQLVNLGHTVVRAYDLDLHYRLDTARRGRFTLNFGLDWLARLRRQIHPGAPEEPYAGYASQPRITALAGLEWSWRDWAAAANLRYTGRYAYAPSANSLLTCPSSQQRLGRCSTPAFSLLDLDLDYAGFAHWRVSLNVHNVLDHRPVYYGNAAIGYNPAFDDVVGRYFLLSFRYRH